MWYVEAGKYNVLPLDSRGTLRFADERPQIADDAHRPTSTIPGTQTVPENVAAEVLNRAAQPSRRMSRSPRAARKGVLICHGSNAGGYALFVKDGKLHYVHNYVGAQDSMSSRASRCRKGKRQLRFEFEPTGKPDIAKGKGTPGRAQLYIDGKLVGQADLPSHRAAALGLGGGLRSAAIPARPCRSSTGRRSRSPARSSRSPPTSPGRCSRTPKKSGRPPPKAAVSPAVDCIENQVLNSVASCVGGSRGSL